MATKKRQTTDTLSTEPVENPTPQPKSSKAKQADYFEEWRVETKIRKDENDNTVVSVEKLKRVREVVKITQEEADIINTGAVSPSSYNPIMYLRPDQDMDEFTTTFKKKG